MSSAENTFYITSERTRETVEKFVKNLPLNEVDEETGEIGKKITWRFLFKKVGNERSLPQNNYLFGVVYPPLMEYMGLRGDKEKAELHAFWCIEYFGSVEKRYLHRKKITPRRTTTTDEQGHRNPLGKVEFAGFVDFVIQKAAENGVYVPPPDQEYWKDK